MMSAVTRTYARFGEHLALFLRHDAGDVVRSLAHEACGLAQNLGAVIGRRRPPDFEAFRRRRQRLVEIARAGMGKPSERLLGRRIDDILALAAVAVKPSAADVKREIGVHGCLVCKALFVAEEIPPIAPVGKG
jgi:hypothetical protein